MESYDDIAYNLVYSYLSDDIRSRLRDKIIEDRSIYIDDIAYDLQMFFDKFVEIYKNKKEEKEKISSSDDEVADREPSITKEDDELPTCEYRDILYDDMCSEYYSLIDDIICGNYTCSVANQFREELISYLKQRIEQE